MRIAALEEALKARTREDLEKLIEALDILCNKLPEQLIQEMGLRTLRELVKLAMKLKDGDQHNPSERSTNGPIL